MLRQCSVLPSPRRLIGRLGVSRLSLSLSLSWRRLGHEAHLLAIPTLAAPAQAFGVDDASAGAAAPWIV
jgi:hypothetical protein